MDRVDELLAGMRAFKEKVTLGISGVSPNIFQEAIGRDRRMACYVTSFSMAPSFDLVGGARVVCSIAYTNTDLPQADVHCISSADEVRRLLSRYIGDYKRRLAIVAPHSLDVLSAYQRFVDNDGPFYPNFTEASLSYTSFGEIGLNVYLVSVKYRIGKVKLAMMEQDTDREVDRLAALLFVPGMPEETRAYLAHNYLCNTVRYVDKETASNLERSYLQSAYGALIRHGCVCQGYAEAFKRLMDAAGVPCDVVTGATDTERDADHAWNIIKLHGERDNYHIDVTWDASDPGSISYSYFGLSDSALSSGRRWNRSFNAPCRSTSDLLSAAKRYIVMNRAALIRRGIPPAVLGF